MAIPYNNHLELSAYQSYPNWHKIAECFEKEKSLFPNQTTRAADGVFKQSLEQPFVRGFQALRDTARLVLKVPIRSIKTPIILEKNWQQRERALINAKLVGYSTLQFALVPVKFLISIVALIVSIFSKDKAKQILDKSDSMTDFLDGRAAQLEALKEEGCKKAVNKQEFLEYKEWLYSIDPKLCKKG